MALLQYGYISYTSFDLIADVDLAQRAYDFNRCGTAQSILILR
jgi:hypothetical protein